MIPHLCLTRRSNDQVVDLEGHRSLRSDQPNAGRVPTGSARTGCHPLLNHTASSGLGGSGAVRDPASPVVAAVARSRQVAFCVRGRMVLWVHLLRLSTLCSPLGGCSGRPASGCAVADLACPRSTRLS